MPWAAGLAKDPKPDKAQPGELAAQREDNIYSGNHLHWLAVQESGLIAPLANGVKSRLNEQRVARKNFELNHRAVLGNDGLKPDGARNARRLGQLRINRAHLIDELGLLDVPALADARGSGLGGAEAGWNPGRHQ